MNTIKEFSHPDLGVRIDVKNVVLSTLLLLLGIGLTYYSLNLAGADENSVVMLLGIGIAFVIAAIVCYVVGGKALYFLPTMSKMEFKTKHYDAEALSAIKQFVATGKCPVTQMFCSKDIGNIRLDILKASDNTFAVIQVYKYTDLLYEPQTEVRVLNVGEVEELLKFVKF